MTILMHAVHEQVALMNSSFNEMCLLLYVHEQFTMPLDLLVFQKERTGARVNKTKPDIENASN